MPSGRKKIPIDMKRVDYMLKAGCDGASIARSMKIHPDTLYDHISKKFKSVFSAYKAQKIEEGNDLLHMAQFKNAIKGNTSMQIWLGKQRLGQSDKTESVQTHTLSAEDLRNFIDNQDTEEGVDGSPAG